MLCNINNFKKIYSVALSCVNKEHIQITFNWANECRRSFQITEFEYILIENVLLEKLQLKIKSRWNQKLDINELLERSVID